MQLILILFLLSMTDGSNDLNETLKKALSFYRENREIITMLANGNFPLAPPVQEKSGQTEPTQKKDRPEEVGQSNDSKHAIEQFLSSYGI